MSASPHDILSLSSQRDPYPCKLGREERCELKKVMPVHPGMWPERVVPLCLPWFGAMCDRAFNRLRIVDVDRAAHENLDDYRYVVYARNPDPEIPITLVYLSSFDPRDTPAD